MHHSVASAADCLEVIADRGNAVEASLLRNGEKIMSLIIVYVIGIFVGDLIALGIAEVIERFSEKASLMAFLALYFVVFWLAWQLAVRITEPKASAPR
jgi:hypothetical protein